MGHEKEHTGVVFEVWSLYHHHRYGPCKIYVVALSMAHGIVRSWWRSHSRGESLSDTRIATAYDLMGFYSTTMNNHCITEGVRLQHQVNLSMNGD